MHDSEQAPRKVYLSPENLAEKMTPAQLTSVIEHQETVFRDGRIIEEPLPAADNDRLRQTYTEFAENREIYDDYPEIEHALDNDPILQALLPQDPSRDTKPEQSRAIRIRASVVAAQLVLQKSVKLGIAS